MVFALRRNSGDSGAANPVNRDRATTVASTDRCIVKGWSLNVGKGHQHRNEH